MKTGWLHQQIGMTQEPRNRRSAPLLGLLLLGVVGVTSMAPPVQAQSNQPPAGAATETEQPTWPALRPGDTGDAVRQLQTELRHIGLFTAPIDGVYGPSTTSAVRAFQQQQGLTADGVVGAQTWQAIAIAQSPGASFDLKPFSDESVPAFTPLTFSQPPPPPSPFWLVLMPLIPLVGGALTYLQRRLQGRQPIQTNAPAPGRHRRQGNKHPRP